MSWAPAIFAARTTASASGSTVEAGDVLGDGAVEEGDVLGDVADVAAEVVAVVVELGAVEAHRPRVGPPDAGEGAGEGRLARGRGADDAERLAGLEA